MSLGEVANRLDNKMDLLSRQLSEALGLIDRLSERVTALETNQRELYRKLDSLGRGEDVSEAVEKLGAAQTAKAPNKRKA